MNRVLRDYLIFLISPFIFLVTKLSYWSENSLKYGVPIIIGFVGTSIHYYGDSVKYCERFLEYTSFDVTDFLINLYENKTIDFGVPLISFVTAQFTQSPKILFFLFGIIFGHFYSKNINLAIKLCVKDIKHRDIKFLLILIAMVIPFWDGVNGIRMWTAAHIYIFGVTNFFLNKKGKTFPYLFLACCFHFSFIFPFVWFISYLGLLKFKWANGKIFLILFLSTTLVTIFDFELIKGIIENSTPKFLSSKLIDYTNEDYILKVEDKIEGKSFHAKYHMLFLKLPVIILLINNYYQESKNTLKRIDSQLFTYFILFFFSFSNLLSLLPSGSRFLKIAMILAILKFIKDFNPYKRNIYNYFLIPLFFWLVIQLRTSFYVLSVYSIFGNPILLFYVESIENLESLIW